MNILPDAPAGLLLSLPPPDLSAPAILAQLEAHWGLQGRLTRLASERDLNHRLADPSGRFLVKLAHVAEPEALTRFQVRALQHLAEHDPELPVLRHVATRAGADFVETGAGRMRVATWIEGASLSQAARSDAQRRAVGAALGRLTRALHAFDHPGADHVLLWDIQQFPRLAPILPSLPDPGLRDAATAALVDFEQRLAPFLGRLPRQICHADFNPSNLLVDPEDPDRVTGILDFGDMVRTPRVCDLAVAASYQIDTDRPLESLRAFLGGYATWVALRRDEVALLYDLILARLMTTRVIPSWRAARNPENSAYILRNVPGAVSGMRALQAQGREAATAAFLAALAPFT